MHTSKTISSVIAASVAVAILAACSAGSSQVSSVPLDATGMTESAQQQDLQHGRFNDILTRNDSSVSRRPVTAPSFMSPDAVGKPLIFVSDYKNMVLDIYAQARPNKLVGQITGFGNTYPGGLATDTARNLYVTNGANVVVYAPPYTGPAILTLSDNGYFSSAVAVSGSGVVAVANACNAPSCGTGTGSVVFYAKHSSSPCATVVANPTIFRYVGFDAFDAKGNLFVDGGTTGSNFPGVVGEIVGGCKAKKIELLSTTDFLRDPAGIQVDKRGRIAILEALDDVIDTFRPPKHRSLGSPVSTTSLTSPGTDQAFAFVASGLDLYAGELTGPVSKPVGLVNKFDYNANNGTEDTITIDNAGWPDGIAVNPPLVP